MKLTLEFFRALCETRDFRINGVDADWEDFGTKIDRHPELAEPYGCGDMRFEAKPATQEVLDKYRITEDEYDEICDKLTTGLSFGTCGWCI